MAGRPANLTIRVTSDSRQAQRDMREMPGRVSGMMDSLKSAGPAAAAAAGAAIGAAIIGAFSEALDQRRITATLGAQLGATPKQAKRYGEIAGDLLAKGITADFQTASDSIGEVMRAGLLDPTATDKQIRQMATKVSDLATTFGQESSQIARSVSQMLKTGMADSAAEAFDILTRGFQTGGNAADDLLDTFSEYSTQFRKLGLDGADAMGLISQGLKGGARDADVVADALKEFSIRAVDGSESTKRGFDAIGLSADEMARKFGTGGDTAKRALDETIDRLRAMKDPVDQSRAAVDLFGTQAEDLGAALFSLDPSEAVNSLGKVGGAAGRMGKTLRSGRTDVQQLYSRLKQEFVESINNHAIPALSRFGRWVNRNRDSLAAIVAFVNARFVLAWNAIKAVADQVSGAYRRNEKELRPLTGALKSAWRLVSKNLIPILTKLGTKVGTLVGFYLAGLISAIAAVVTFISWLVDWIKSAVSWLAELGRWLSRIKPPGWLSDLAGSIGGIFSAAPFSGGPDTGNGIRTLTAAETRAISVPTVMTMSRPAPVVNVYIDGRQITGMVQRTVSGALATEGIRRRAGSRYT
ncbi:phage tail tape measure protein [Streptomyces sp. WMMC500]|uniref:phage tail tape measure protein n=1 Tax=Streptomyces sp. WMMC500 TaxID=3015154 RepID=UPI00248BBBB1|nr:phage tail tape measure protein [Streptomyces sp. WMMC500]WBB59349.1 phage tail tape measure protein [Streptomyces sp. WMMC500]